jgi:hypothetical protein
MLFKGGEIVERVVGFKAQAALEAQFAAHVA